jgi:hypothetical protein
MHDRDLPARRQSQPQYLSKMPKARGPLAPGSKNPRATRSTALLVGLRHTLRPQYSRSCGPLNESAHCAQTESRLGVTEENGAHHSRRMIVLDPSFSRTIGIPAFAGASSSHLRLRHVPPADRALESLEPFCKVHSGRKVRSHFPAPPLRLGHEDRPRIEEL